MNFSININPIRHNIEALSLSMPYTYETIISELEKETWNKNNHKSSKDNTTSKRHLIVDPNSKILKEIKDFVTSDTVKEQIINSFYKDFPDIENVWNGWTKKQMFERTVWDGFFVMDEPGFSMSKHLDSRTNVATGIVYLNKEADEKRTTVFYTDKEGNNELKIDNRFSQGVISVNDSNTWHEIQNKTNEPRYVMVLVLLLLIDFYDPEKHKGLFDPLPKITL